MVVQLAKALTDLDLPSTFANYQTVDIGRKMMLLAGKKIKRTDLIAMEHFAGCLPNEDPRYKSIIRLVYRHAVDKIAEGNLHYYPFQALINCLKHLGG
jgi:hypothetical protein